MNGCADSTALRAHLDHNDPGLEEHLDGCAVCSGLLRSVAADAGFVRQALAVLDPPAGAEGVHSVDVEAALVAVAGPEQVAVPAPAPAPAERRRHVRRRLAVSGAAALVALVVGLTPAGGALADALDVFRSDRMQVVTVDFETWAALDSPEDLRAFEALGDVDISLLSEPRPVSGIAEAESVSGIEAPKLGDRPDRVLALAPGTARLTLAARDGNGVPAELDGATLVVEVPGAVGAIYRSDAGAPELVVGRSGRLVVRAEGAPLEEIRTFLLGRDELPPDLRSQLAAIRDWRSTIPVPVPVNGPGWKDVEVGGRPAIAFGDDSGLGAIVLRQDPDGVTVVGGPISVSRAMSLAARA